MAKKLDLILDQLNGRKIPAFYVQCPYKNLLGCSILPEHAEVDYANYNADMFLEQLKTKNVAVLDLRPYVTADMSSLKEYYFKTDHHWNFDGVMHIYPLVVKALLRVMKEEVAVSFYISPNNWKRCKMGRTFLGTNSRRTGAFFAGEDELAYYLPKFKTEMQVHVYTKEFSDYSLKMGPFEYSLFQHELLQKPISHLYDSGYSIYGGDRPLVRIRNKSAPIRKKILILKDSYALPLVAFMTTVFQSIDMIDLRHYTNGLPIFDYIDANTPDAVCFIYNPGAISMGQKFWQFNRSDLESSKCKKLTEMDLSLVKKESQYNYGTIATNLTLGAGYLVSVKDLKVVPDLTGAVTVGICDTSTWRLVAKASLGVGFGTDNVFLRCPERKSCYSLVLYAGQMGSTSNVSLECRGVEVYEYLH